MTARDLLTYLVVSAVTLLIWLWAAGETRQDRTISYARVQFIASDSDNWLINPGQTPMTVMVQGSRLAIEKVENLLRRPLRMEVRAAAGAQTIDLAQQLRELREIRDTGATIRSVEPPTQDIDLDHVERVTAAVKPVLRGVQAHDGLKSDPAEVILAMPSRLRQRIPTDITVEAIVEQSELDRLERGVPQTLEVKVRAPEWLTYAGNVTVTPPKIQLSFTIRSRQAEIILDSVPVQVADLADDRPKYAVEINPTALRNVTITAESDLIRRISAGEVPVVAVLHLSPREKADRIGGKAISYFIALVPDANGGSEGTLVKGRIGDSSDAPVVQVRITDRP